MAQNRWTREELILSLNLYLKLSFGKLHSRNADIIHLAGLIGRTPGSVAMRLNNFAAVDPFHQQRGIVGLGMGCASAEKDMKKNAEHIKAMRDLLETELLKIEDTRVKGRMVNRLFNTANLKFAGVDSDAMIMGLSNSDSLLALMAVSNGSACTSTSIKPSHILMAMGLDEVASFSAIRFSIGKFNAQKEMDLVIGAVKNVVIDLRAMVN
jgi:cysteine sulfinate desulfinase/cysteine desulfurase-like protein